MAQASALFPMMQFSLAPWRVLSKESFELVKMAAMLHKSMADEIVALVEDAEKTGEPILRSLEYNDPGHGYSTVKDQFMLGTDILVCPVINIRCGDVLKNLRHICKKHCVKNTGIIMNKQILYASTFLIKSLESTFKGLFLALFT